MTFLPIYWPGPPLQISDHFLDFDQTPPPCTSSFSTAFPRVPSVLPTLGSHCRALPGSSRDRRIWCSRCGDMGVLVFWHWLDFILGSAAHTPLFSHTSLTHPPPLLHLQFYPDPRSASLQKSQSVSTHLFSILFNHFFTFTFDFFYSLVSFTFNLPFNIVLFNLLNHLFLKNI
jgi:hypothetical protein